MLVWIAPLAEKAAFMIVSHMLEQLIFSIKPLMAEPAIMVFY